MKRTQLQLDDSTYELLRQHAAEQGISVSALVQRVLNDYLGMYKPKTIQDFKFIGAGRSKKSDLDPISERHDEALAQDFHK